MVREELSKRNLSDVPTNKLIEIELKIIEAVNKIGADTIMCANKDSTFLSFIKEVG